MNSVRLLPPRASCIHMRRPREFEHFCGGASINYAGGGALQGFRTSCVRVSGFGGVVLQCFSPFFFSFTLQPTPGQADPNSTCSSLVSLDWRYGTWVAFFSGRSSPRAFTTLPRARSPWWTVKEGHAWSTHAGDHSQNMPRVRGEGNSGGVHKEN